MSRRITRRAVVLLLTVGALLTAAFAAVPQADAATLYACVKKEGGSMRFVSQHTKCSKSERKLAWNTTGPAGARGGNGANGANGKDGANGTNGTNGKEGLTGKEGIAGPFPGTLPRGITLRGNFNIGGTAAAGGNVVEGDISFGFSFASAPTYRFIKPSGASTPECPGTVEAPEAAPGNLCAYASTTDNTTALLANVSNKWGDTVFVSPTAGGNFFAEGTWAATSP